ncbi:MAG: FHA domain-containing protein [bacterium]|nr:FHA domain-containing protein [bacterium]
MMVLDKTVVQDEKELKGWLVVLTGEWKGKDYPLFEGKAVIGSSHYANIYLPEEGIEHFHFSIRFRDGDVFITDLDSDAGLFIDGERFYREKVEDETVFKTSDVAFLIKIL